MPHHLRRDRFESEEKYSKCYKSYKIKKYYEDYADFVYDFENGDLNYKFEMEENNITNQKERKKRDTLRHLFSSKFTIIGVGAVMVRPSIAKCSLHHNFLINFFYEIFLALYDNSTIEGETKEEKAITRDGMLAEAVTKLEGDFKKDEKDFKTIEFFWKKKGKELQVKEFPPLPFNVSTFITKLGQRNEKDGHFYVRKSAKDKPTS